MGQFGGLTRYLPQESAQWFNSSRLPPKDDNLTAQDLLAAADLLVGSFLGTSPQQTDDIDSLVNKRPARHPLESLGVAGASLSVFLLGVSLSGDAASCGHFSSLDPSSDG